MQDIGWQIDTEVVRESIVISMSWADYEDLGRRSVNPIS